MSEVNLIQMSDIYFDFFKPKVVREALKPPFDNQMHHGEIFIYQDQIILGEDNYWYMAYIQDIIEIKTLIPKKQILIHLNDYDMVLCCKDISQLLAIRDFLNLSQNYFMEKNSIHPRADTLIGNKFPQEMQRNNDKEFQENYDKISDQ